jgi:hypothetical protein
VFLRVTVDFQKFKQHPFRQGPPTANQSHKVANALVGVESGIHQYHLYTMCTPLALLQRYTQKDHFVIHILTPPKDPLNTQSAIAAIEINSSQNTQAKLVIALSSASAWFLYAPSAARLTLAVRPLSTPPHPPQAHEVDHPIIHS